MEFNRIFWSIVSVVMTFSPAAFGQDVKFPSYLSAKNIEAGSVTIVKAEGSTKKTRHMRLAFS